MKVFVLDKLTTNIIDRFDSVKSFEKHVSDYTGISLIGFYAAAKYHNSKKQICVPSQFLEYTQDRLRANM